MGTKISVCTRSVVAFVVLVGWFSVSPSRMTAQSIAAGQKAVYNSSNNVTGSTAWVDLSAWWSVSGLGIPDLCALIRTNVLTSTYGSMSFYPNGTVIDARGLAYGVSGNPQQIACSVDPFGALAGPPPSTTILLPSGNILTTQTWTLPNNTRIVGDQQQTVIKAVDPSTTVPFSGSYIIEMGGVDATSNKNLCPTVGSSPLCTSVGIEHLQLGGGGTGAGVGGIQNQYSGAGSYVNDVNMENFSLTGLSITAANSGPYSNIVYIAKSTCGSSGCRCIDVKAQTQGIHGVTCIGNTTTHGLDQGAGILVNASNNSLEDVHIEAFWDGIEVGTSGTVANVLLSNITGTTTGSGDTAAPTKNTVHLCGGNSLDSGLGTCASHGTLQDITVLHAMNFSGPNTTTVVDDVTKNAIVSCDSGSSTPGCAVPLSTGMYALGEPDAGAGTGAHGPYSMFTSSPTTPNGYYQNNPPASSYMPTWGVGNTSAATNPDDAR